MPDRFEGLYRLEKKDVAKAAATLADAFSGDPLWQAVIPDYQSACKSVQAVFEVPVKYCMKYGAAFSSSPRIEGMAAWVAGEYAGVTFWRMIVSGALRSGIKMGFKFAKKMMPLMRPIEEERKKNMQDKKYIYLQVIGVGQEYHGRGFGGRLLRAVMGEADRTGRCLYLETETENNVAMYERFGFKLIGKIILPVENLPMWSMVREAHS